VKLGAHIYIDSLEQNAAEALQKLGCACSVTLWRTRNDMSASRTRARLKSVADAAVCHITAKPVLRPFVQNTDRSE
jgi:hypothetical protein